uniref:Uncharacterized protein n=1 Tax=Hanusia phi TaxID=3032 RepID=A0A7S0HAD5_9CRYP
MKKKKEMLRESRDKLNKAIKINPDAITANGDYAIFQLGSIFYINFLYEEDDKQAEQYFEKCKLCFSKGAKRYPHIGPISTPDNAYEERAHIQATAKRMQGKTQQEQLQEYVQMVQEEHARCEQKLKENPEDTNLLMANARSMLELSQYDLMNSRLLVEKATTQLRKCLQLERSCEVLTMLSLALNSRGLGQPFAEGARADLVEARECFTEAITLEQDPVMQRQMLLQLRDMYGFYAMWKERCPEQADQLVVDQVPDWLADLPDSIVSPNMSEASALNTRELVSHLKRGSRQGRRVKNEQTKAMAPPPKVDRSEEVEEVKETSEQAPSSAASAEAKKKKKKRKKAKNKSAPTPEDPAPERYVTPDTKTGPSFPSATSLGLVGACAAAALVAAYLVIRSRRAAAS